MPEQSAAALVAAVDQVAADLKDSNLQQRATNRRLDRHQGAFRLAMVLNVLLMVLIVAGGALVVHDRDRAAHDRDRAAAAQAHAICESSNQVRTGIAQFVARFVVNPNPNVPDSPERAASRAAFIAEAAKDFAPLDCGP